ncbi:hypothetical protein BSP10_152 [Bacillus phage BSP10]|nr:hypothetical protein BSP10_152 [Bacillus phage BSP10]QRI44602.1 hypothetical protein BSTP3_056 [Bacillus phage BSTP3]
MDYVWYLVWHYRESNTVRIFDTITSILGLMMNISCSS